jgi:hypothetical protein
LLAFGAISKATGMNYGATMNAPTLTGSFAPGAQLIANLLNAIGTGGQYVAARAAGNETWMPTDVEKRDALKGFLPRSLHGVIERRFQQPNEPYQTTERARGLVFRDNKDWQARHLGTFSLDETKEKAALYQSERKERELSEKKTNFIPKLADHLVKGGEVNEQWISKAEDLEYTGPELIEALRREIKNRLTSKMERDVKTGHTPRQARLYEVYRELGGQ